jgi:hypothetical protein
MNFIPRYFVHTQNPKMFYIMFLLAKMICFCIVHFFKYSTCVGTKSQRSVRHTVDIFCTHGTVNTVYYTTGLQFILPWMLNVWPSLLLKVVDSIRYLSTQFSYFHILYIRFPFRKIHREVSLFGLKNWKLLNRKDLIQNIITSCYFVCKFFFSILK